MRTNILPELLILLLSLFLPPTTPLQIGGSIIHWRGDTKSYTRDLRHVELLNSVAVESGVLASSSIFVDLLPPSDELQYVPPTLTLPPSSVKRCALVRSTFTILGVGQSLSECCESSLPALSSLSINPSTTWSIRIRNYSEEGGKKTLGKLGFRSSFSDPNYERDIIESMGNTFLE